MGKETFCCCFCYISIPAMNAVFLYLILPTYSVLGSGLQFQIDVGTFLWYLSRVKYESKVSHKFKVLQFFFKFTELRKFVKKSRCIDIMDIRIFTPKIIMKIFWALKFKVRHFCDFHYLICWVLRNGTEMDLQINWPNQQTVQNVPNTFVEQKIHLMKIPKWPLGWYSVEVIWTMIWKAKISTVSRVKQ